MTRTFSPSISPTYAWPAASPLAFGTPIEDTGPLRPVTKPTRISARTGAIAPSRSAAPINNVFLFFMDVTRCGRGGLTLPGHQRKHAQRTAGAVLDLERRGHDHSTGRRQLIEIAQALQAVAPAAVQEMVRRIGRIE